MDVHHLDHVNLRIPANGIDEAVAFYHGILGFTPERLDAYRDGDRTSFAFQLGDTTLLHVRPVDDFTEPDERNFDHFCIVVNTDIETVKQQLQEHGALIQRESTPWGATGRSPAVYVKDPFGYSIEIKEQP